MFCVSLMHASTESVSLYVCQSCIALKDLLHWCPPSSLAATVFPPSFPLSPGWGEFDGVIVQAVDAQHKTNSTVSLEVLCLIMLSQLIFTFTSHVTGPFCIRIMDPGLCFYEILVCKHVFLSIYISFLSIFFGSFSSLCLFYPSWICFFKTFLMYFIIILQMPLCFLKKARKVNGCSGADHKF